MAQKFVHGVGPPLARIPGGYLWIIIGRAADLHKRPIAALHDRQVEPPLLLHELTQKLCAFSNYCGGGMARPWGRLRWRCPEPTASR